MEDIRQSDEVIIYKREEVSQMRADDTHGAGMFVGRGIGVSSLHSRTYYMLEPLFWGKQITVLKQITFLNISDLFWTRILEERSLYMLRISGILGLNRSDIIGIISLHSRAYHMLEPLF